MKNRIKLVFRRFLQSIGVVFFCWFLGPAFVTGSVHIGTITGVALSVFAFLYGTFFSRFNSWIGKLWKSTGGKVLEITVAVILTVIFVLAAACAVAIGIGASQKALPQSTVIVLGCRVYGTDRPGLMLKARLDAALEYLQANPESCCIVTGGQGQNELVTESSVMYQYMKNAGLPEDRLFEEGQALDTEENLAYSREIIEQYGLNETVAVATNDYHAYRAIQEAKRAGLEAGAIPADTIWYMAPTSYIREMYGILEGWFLK